MIQLLNGDCLELMATLPDKSVDLFLCDLPYGCLTGGAGKDKAKRIANVANNHRKACPPTDRGERTLSDGTIASAGILGGCKWDIPIDLNAFWVQVKRLCKNEHTPVLMFCTAKFGYELIKSNEDWFRYDLVWNKTRAVSFLLANKMPMRSHELIYVFSKAGANYTRIDIEGDFKKSAGGRHNKDDSTGLYGTIKSGEKPNNEGKRCVKSVIDCANAGVRGNHPTQKPNDLYEWLITRYSKEGDTILDPTAGSFASCFTAQRLGRNAIGIEKDKGFFDKANNLVEK